MTAAKRKTEPGRAKPSRRANVDDLTCEVRMVHLEKVSAARRHAPAPDELARLAGLYKALGDPGRLGILLALRGGEMCVCDLAATVGASESATSHQLRRLREKALVKNRREGPMLYYSLDDQHVAELIEAALAHVRE